MRSSFRAVRRAGLLAAAALWAWTGIAQANHRVQIDEVVAGVFGRPEIQFVEVRLGDCNQSWANLARLQAFNAFDEVIGEFVFTSNPSCSATGQSVLIGTQAYADLASAPDPNFIIPPILAPGDGKVCFLTSESTLCLSYGRFDGNTQEGTGTNAPRPAPEGICALQRNGFFNDFSTPNFNEDFILAVPAPRNGAGTTGTVVVPPRFNDVLSASPFFPFIEALFNAGVTGGCGNGAFCPGNAVTREQMAVFLLTAVEGPGFAPPACTSPAFNDVPCSSPFAPWINELAARGITGGCGNGNYCPGTVVTREQMAVFLLATADGPASMPAACVSPPFDDVSCANPFAPWIAALVSRGVTGGCGNNNYCPGNSVTREQMAVFLSVLFDFPVPTTACPAP
jgi:hypothetical protein